MRDSARARVFVYMRLVVAGQNETQHRGGTRLCGKSHSAVARMGSTMGAWADPLTLIAVPFWHVLCMKAYI